MHARPLAIGHFVSTVFFHENIGALLPFSIGLSNLGGINIVGLPKLFMWKLYFGYSTLNKQTIQGCCFFHLSTMKLGVQNYLDTHPTGGSGDKNLHLF